ncbi:hypothetical protein GQ43DRAFT_467990 [Delitschia confertaspora ATCC 74209]|uniref:Uncharacterized protein n=1 Tax=Delitschia confertaspora ATCC 74209 TaxID=1513339 RepID=A0A9P4JZZ9_9PLEO|nr:hypothetical protein GQ43DRAFT_467990 [Delitschia confertaspora ATCC 74209]
MRYGRTRGSRLCHLSVSAQLVAPYPHLLGLRSGPMVQVRVLDSRCDAAAGFSHGVAGGYGLQLSDGLRRACPTTSTPLSVSGCGWWTLQFQASFSVQSPPAIVSSYTSACAPREEALVTVVYPSPWRKTRRTRRSRSRRGAPGHSAYLKVCQTPLRLEWSNILVSIFILSGSVWFFVVVWTQDGKLGRAFNEPNYVTPVRLLFMCLTLSRGDKDNY